MYPVIHKKILSSADDFLGETEILDYRHPEIQNLIIKENWKNLESIESKIRKVYNFVRDDIKFGYQEIDAVPASRVLGDGYGQCNTKANLLMALLRALEIPCRFHGFTIDKALQKGAIPGIWFKLAPANIVHSWVEVQVDKKWYNLEGVILDKKYLSQVQKKNVKQTGPFCGFGIYTSNLQNPVIDWNLNDTYIQDLGINQDFGVYPSPDEFYREHGQNLNFIKKFVFKYVGRHMINRNVERLRNFKESV